MTDLHFTPATSPNLKMSYWALAKHALTWIADLAKSINPELIICGGDTIDSWDWTSSNTYKLSELFNQFPSPVYAVIGNHDVNSGNLSLVSWSGIGQLHANCPNFKIFYTPLSTENFLVFPYHWHDKRTHNHTKYDLWYPESFKTDKCTVLVSHASITRDKCDYGHHWKELEIPDFFKIALFGDIHTGFGPHKLGKTVVGNPGALYRKRVDERDNVPAVFVVWPDGKIDKYVIPQIPDDQVFKLEEIAEKSKWKTLNLQAAIQAKSITSDDNIIEQVKIMGETLKLRPEAIQEVLSRIPH